MRPHPVPAPKRKVHPLLKALIALVAIGVVGFLFVRTARDARSEAYAVQASYLKDWTLAASADTAAGLGVAAVDRDAVVIALRPKPELPMNLFRQLFSRQMESMVTPREPGIPLVLRHEIPGDVTATEVLALAQQAGLEHATLTPKCVGYRRISARGVTRQLYFVWFDVPGFDRFRQAVASRAGSGFVPKGLSPVLIMAAQPDFVGWLPIVADEQADCVASVTVE